MFSEESLPAFWTKGSGAPLDRPGTATAGPAPAEPPRGAPGLPLPEGKWTYHAGEHPAPGIGNPGAVREVPGDSGGSWIDRVDLSDVHQVAATFLVASGPDGIVVVDQHTAHERILFEEAVIRMEKGAGESQQLLIPETLEVDPELESIAEEYSGLLEKAGFRLRAVGPRALLLEGVPLGLRNGNPARFLREFLEGLAKGGGEERSRSRRVAATVACHGAVRAGDSLTPEERRALLTRLIRCDQPLRCPRGHRKLLKTERLQCQDDETARPRRWDQLQHLGRRATPPSYRALGETPRGRSSLRDSA